MTSRGYRQLVVVVVLIALAIYYGPTVIGLGMAAYHEHQWGLYHPAPHTDVMNMGSTTVISDGMMHGNFTSVPPSLLSFPLAYDPDHGMLFPGRLTSPNGTPYWAGLTFDQVSGFWPTSNPGEGGFFAIGIKGCSLSTGRLFHPPETVWFADQWRILRVNPNCKGPFVFYAGEQDPVDPSHFTIDYTYAGTPGTIDGKITDWGAIVLTPRAGTVVHGVGGPGATWSPIPAPISPVAP